MALFAGSERRSPWRASLEIIVLDYGSQKGVIGIRKHVWFHQLDNIKLAALILKCFCIRILYRVNGKHLAD